MSELFREYDVRGIYGKELTEEFAYKLGKAYGTVINGKVVVGRDGRLSSKTLQNSFMDGLVSTGAHVLDLGLISTPAVYLAIKLLNVDGGVIVTASHNPKEWNGFKLCDKNGYTIDNSNFKSIFLNGKFSKGIGSVEKYNFIPEYENFLLRLSGIEKVNAAVDTGNGVAGVYDIFEKLGMEVINKEVDGNFPNRPPEPNENTLEKLREVVLDGNLNFGVGLDGDADRAIFVDDKGRVLDSSVTLAILSMKLLKTKRAKVVFDISSSLFIEDFVKKNKGIPIISKTGRRNIIKKMKEEDADIGGEFSGHLYFKELFGFDDGVYAILKMAKALSGKKLSQIVDEIVKYKLYLKKATVECDDEKKFEVVKRIKDKLVKKYRNYVDIDGIKIYTDFGWFLIRASNTKPEIRVMVESKDENIAESKLKELVGFVRGEVNGS